MFMYFLDESGVPEIPGRSPKYPDTVDNRFFTLGGIILNTDDWHGLKDAMNGCKKDRRIPIDAELKWRDLLRQTGPAAHLTQQEAIDFLKDLAARILANNVDAVGIATVVNKVAANAKPYINDSGDIYNIALRCCLQRFGNHLYHDRGGREHKAMVVADKRQDKQDEKVRAHFEALVLGGELYEGAMAWRAVDAVKNFRHQVIESLLFQASDHSVGLQLADFIVGPIQIRAVGRDAGYYEAIEPLLRKSAAGTVKGYGVVDFP